METNSQLLFVYGTLKDSEYRRALFGVELPYTDAVLVNFQLLSSGGFFFVVPCPQSDVMGLILELTQEQILLVDQWEEVPMYTRSLTSVSCNGQNVNVWIYTRYGIEGEPADSSAASTLTREQVMRHIDEFHKGCA